jgi:hypothetical protein
MLREEVEDYSNMVDVTPKPAKSLALDLPDIPEPAAEAGEPNDDTANARNDIATAINTEMLAHLREVYPDADWESLTAEYDAKLESLQAATA